MATTTISIDRLWPMPARAENSRLVAAASRPPMNRIRITPKRFTSTPPSTAPSRVMITPNTLVTLATSDLLKPMST